jgi:hypothetical protein
MRELCQIDPLKRLGYYSNISGAWNEMAKEEIGESGYGRKEKQVSSE